jgi:hypothetical protein
MLKATYINEIDPELLKMICYELGYSDQPALRKHSAVYVGKLELNKLYNTVLLKLDRKTIFVNTGIEPIATIIRTPGEFSVIRLLSDAKLVYELELGILQSINHRLKLEPVDMVEINKITFFSPMIFFSFLLLAILSAALVILIAWINA